MAMDWLAGAWIEYQGAALTVTVLVREIEHVGDRSRDRVHRIRDPEQAPVIFDKRQDRALIRSRVIDVGFLRERRDHDEGHPRAVAASTADAVGVRGSAQLLARVFEVRMRDRSRRTDVRGRI